MMDLEATAEVKAAWADWEASHKNWETRIFKENDGIDDNLNYRGEQLAKGFVQTGLSASDAEFHATGLVITYVIRMIAERERDAGSKIAMMPTETIRDQVALEGEAKIATHRTDCLKQLIINRLFGIRRIDGQVAA